MDHLVDSNATGQGAALVDFLRSSPDAIVQLVQGLKAASSMPQFDPAQAAASGLLQQAAAPAAAEGSMQAFSGTAMPASSMQASAGLQHHTQQDASAVLLGHLDLSQLACLGQGTPAGASTSSQQQAVAGKTGTAQAAGQLKDMLFTLLNQQAVQAPQQQPQPQAGQPPAQPQAADLCWGVPSPHSNNSATVPRHTMLPAPGVHELHAQRLQDGAIQQLQSSLLDVLRSTVQQQQQLQAAAPAPAPQYSQATAPVAQASVAAPGMPAHLSAAALAAALGIAMPQDQVSTIGNGAAAAVAPAPVVQQPDAMVPNYHPGAANGVVAQQQELAHPQQQQQQAGSSMPHLLDRLRAAVISSTAPDGGSSCTPEQQRLLGMVDQLHSAWAQMGTGAGAGSEDAAARAAMAGPHDAVAAAAAAVEAKADADGMPDASGLYMLLEAVQQQVADAAAANGSGRDAIGSAAECGDTDMPQGNGYDAINGNMYAAMNGQHAEAGWGDGHADTSMGYGRGGGYAPQQQGGSSRRKRSRAAEQQQLAAGGGGLAGMLAAVMQQEGMRAEDAVDPTVEQKWLLKPRARGKRQVKPNKVALTGELPPVADRWAGKARRSAEGGAAALGAANSEEDELWKPPRVRATLKRRRTQGGSEDGAGASDKDSQDQQQQSSAGAGRAKGAAASGRRGYGWQLLQQQQPDEAHSPLGTHPEAAEAATEGADAITEGAGVSYSNSGADGADDDGAAGDVTGDVGSADGGSEGGVAAASASAATGAASEAKPRVKASRRDRWVPPTEEWTSDDGLKVWPKVSRLSLRSVFERIGVALRGLACV